VNDDPAHLSRAARRGSPWPSFLVNLSLVFLLSLSALFAGIAANGRRAIDAEIRARARTIFASVVLARRWNALHGGVLVEKTPGMQSSPYLPSPDVTGSDGKVYTRKNPALMAREISGLAEADGAFRFRITSLQPVNPANAADPFEAEALRSFERGAKEATGRETVDGKAYFRFVAPLLVEASCLECHAAQGYRVGDVRGGISVTLNVDEAERAMARNQRLTIGLFLLTALVLTGVIWRLVSALRRRIAAAEARIREMAITDDLTGLRNRRFVLLRLGEEVSRAYRHGHALSCVLFDVDRFKEVNDLHGHAAGDAALRAIAAEALRGCRASDLLARYGGEEFLLLLPETDGAGAFAIAERLRRSLEGLRVEHAGRTLQATASFGVATLSPFDAGPPSGPEALVRRADEALLRAKAAGRNRVERAT
jgi:diguanylate cyclase (GGDEF)-like protein